MDFAETLLFTLTPAVCASTAVFPPGQRWIDFITVSTTVEEVEHPLRVRTKACRSESLSLKPHTLTPTISPTLHLKIWIYHTSERRHDLPKPYARYSVACLAIFDVTSRQSLDFLPDLIAQAREEIGVSVVMTLVATKIDLANRAVTTTEGQLFADRHGMLYAETSSKSGEGVAEMLESTTRAVLEKIETGELEYQVAGLNLEPASNMSSACC